MVSRPVVPEPHVRTPRDHVVQISSPAVVVLRWPGWITTVGSRWGSHATV